MTHLKIATYTMCVGLLSACGGGGGGAGGSAGTPPVMQPPPPPPPGASIDYAELDDQTGTSALAGAVLAAGDSVDPTTGTIMHNGQTFTADAISGSMSLAATSDFNLPDYVFATDIKIDDQTTAIIGVSTAAADLRSSVEAAYTGRFSGQLVDRSLGLTAETLNWDADIQVDFRGSGNIDITLEGGGSALIDEIKISGATIAGNTFAGGTISTSQGGIANDITGTNVDLNGAFFGYNTSLQSPAEAGGAFLSRDADTDLSGVFLSTARP